MDFSNVVAQEDTSDVDGELLSLSNSDGASPKAVPSIWAEVVRFLTNPHKPMILALSRPDPKKNLTTLLKAFGECRPLREFANLVNTHYRYDLYGQVAFPKHHKQSDVPDIYRLAAKTKGVFINPTLVEPFGLTLIEATAHGLPGKLLLSSKKLDPVKDFPPLRMLLASEENGSSKIGVRFDRSIPEGNHASSSAAASFRLESASSSEAERLVIDDLFRVSIDGSERCSLVLFLQVIEKFLLNTEARGALMSKLESLLENVNVVIIDWHTQMEKYNLGASPLAKFRSNQTSLLDAFRVCKHLYLTSNGSN
ncbi:hypothetical protein POM88_032514 [Heracleum sosnowskyi]|uniref:sucrose-phosphate synthase n=1 Tax=Heracleum sosnowskyi TaxID=360622 RepID=A0AAD8MK47_9APIA|nr:hypothetical protein POM88_032514 [Heracleum sosnowskyi]